MRPRASDGGVRATVYEVFCGKFDDGSDKASIHRISETTWYAELPVGSLCAVTEKAKPHDIILGLYEISFRVDLAAQ